MMLLLEFHNKIVKQKIKYRYAYFALTKNFTFHAWLGRIFQFQTVACNYFITIYHFEVKNK